MNDLIRRQAVIDVVLDSIPNDEYWMEQVKKAIFSLPPEQQWTPVSEGLPKKTGCYTVSLKVGVVTYDYWTGDNWGTFVEVEAWMELPKRYEKVD